MLDFLDLPETYSGFVLRRALWIYDARFLISSHYATSDPQEQQAADY
jgi:hypothetical protein